MDVSKLCRASDEEEDCEERNEQNAGWRILRSYFADPSHNYCSLYIMLPELPINERPPGGSVDHRAMASLLHGTEISPRLRMLQLSLKVASCSVKCGDGQRSVSELDAPRMHHALRAVSSRIRKSGSCSNGRVLLCALDLLTSKTKG